MDKVGSDHKKELFVGSRGVRWGHWDCGLGRTMTIIRPSERAPEAGEDMAWAGWVGAEPGILRVWGMNDDDWAPTGGVYADIPVT